MLIVGLSSKRLGLCLTNSFAVFCSLTLITSVTTVTPQLSMSAPNFLVLCNRPS